MRKARESCAELDLRKETKIRVGDAIEMFFRRYSLVLARFEKDMTEFSRGRPAFLVRAVRRFRIGVLREALLRMTKRRFEIGRQSFGDRHQLRIADLDKVVAGGIVFALPVPHGPHPPRKPLHRLGELGTTFQDRSRQIWFEVL